MISARRTRKTVPTESHEETQLRRTRKFGSSLRGRGAGSVGSSPSSWTRCAGANNWPSSPSPAAISLLNFSTPPSHPGLSPPP
jgi:hypothetical protein